MSSVVQVVGAPHRGHGWARAYGKVGAGADGPGPQPPGGAEEEAVAVVVGAKEKSASAQSPGWLATTR